MKRGGGGGGGGGNKTTVPLGKRGHSTIAHSLSRVSGATCVATPVFR